MPEIVSPGGIILPNGYSTKADRSQQASVRPGLSAGQVESKFKDFSSYLSAIKIPWVYACVSLIAYSFANNDYDLMDDKETAITDANNPILQLFARPNPVQSGFQFFELMATYLELVGEVFISLESRDGHGRPTELYLPNPARMRVIPDPDKYVKGYVYEAGGTFQGFNQWSYGQNGNFIPYDPDEIVHIKLPNPLNDYRGFGNIEASETLLNIVTAMGVNEEAYWSSGGRVIGVLETEQKVSDEDFDRIRTMWRQFSADGQQRFKTAILEQGLKYSPVSEGMRSLDVVSIDKGKRDTILAVFGVPAPKLGIMENAAYKLQDAETTFWSETMFPKFTRFEDAIQPLIDLFDDTWSWKWARKNFEDDTQKFNNAKIMQGLYCYTSNQILTYTGAEELGDDGEVIWIPNNMIPVRIERVGALADRDEQQAAAAAAQPGAPGTGSQAAAASPPGALAPNHAPVAAKPAATAKPKPGTSTGSGGVANAQGGSGPVAGKAIPPELQDELDELEYRRFEAARVVQRKMRERGMKAEVTPMGRVRVYDQKRAEPPLPKPKPLKAGNERMPVVAAMTERKRDQLLKTVGSEWKPQLTKAFRQQQAGVIKILPKLPREAEPAKAAIKKAWDPTPVLNALKALRVTAGMAGYQTGHQALFGKGFGLLEGKDWGAFDAARPTGDHTGAAPNPAEPLNQLNQQSVKLAAAANDAANRVEASKQAHEAAVTQHVMALQQARAASVEQRAARQAAVHAAKLARDKAHEVHRQAVAAHHAAVATYRHHQHTLARARRATSHTATHHVSAMHRGRPGHLAIDDFDTKATAVDEDTLVEVTDLADQLEEQGLLNPKLTDEELKAKLYDRLLPPEVEDRLTDIDATTLDAVLNEVTEGIRRGYSPTQIANGVPDEGFDGIVGVFDDATDWRAEMIARTEGMTAMNWGTISAYQDAGVQQVEAMDGSDDPVCAERNGKVFDLDSDSLTPVDENGDQVVDHPNGILSFLPVIPDNVDLMDQAQLDAVDAGADSLGDASTEE